MGYTHIGPQSQSQPSLVLQQGTSRKHNFKDIDRYLGRGVMAKLSRSILNQFFPSGWLPLVPHYHIRLLINSKNLKQKKVTNTIVYITT